MPNKMRKSTVDASKFFSKYAIANESSSARPDNDFVQELNYRLHEEYITNLDNLPTMKKTKLFNKKILLGGVVGVLLTLILVVLVYNSYKDISPEYDEIDNISANSEIGATLSFIQGDVQLTTEDGDWEEAVDEADLFEGYSLKTGENSKAIISLDDGSAVRLNGNTEVTLTSMNPDKYRSYKR